VDAGIECLMGRWWYESECESKDESTKCTMGWGQKEVAYEGA